MDRGETLLLTVNEAAAVLRVSRATLYNLLNSGAFGAVKIGTRTLIAPEALRAYVASLPPWVAR